MAGETKLIKDKATTRTAYFSFLSAETLSAPCVDWLDSGAGFLMEGISLWACLYRKKIGVG